MLDVNSTDTLEWDRVIKEIQRKTTSGVGRDLCPEMPFAETFEEAEQLQQQTAEIFELLDREGNIPLGGIRNIRNSLEMLDKGGLIHGTDFLDIASTLRAGRVLKKFIIAKLNDSNILYSKIFPVYTNQNLEDTIEQSFSSDGNVLDTASARLATIRNTIRSVQQNIREKLLRIIQEPKNKNIVQENIITQRSGRYVIPVKTESQGHIKGIVQDQSLSGSTVYLEPMAVVEDNNKLTMKFNEEKQEIETILRELGEKILPDAEMIDGLLETLAEFDVIKAKAEYCHSIKAKKVHLNKDGIVDLHKVKHPLLITQKGFDEVTPVDIRLGKTFDTLIITGSNTGGKTVTLKTLGLCALMAKFGLYLPTKTESDMSFFEKVLADIGDEQSLEQNLSTFSGHLTHIVEILNEVTESSLVLFDEIGTGTDPSEGAAIAQAIIEKLREKKARIVATTHYGELKVLAYNYQGIANASVEFSLETLSPTYRLLIGVPGKSNAIHIAARLGLPEEVISRANSLMTVGEKDITTSIEKLENEYVLLEDERTRQEEVSVELEKQKEKYQQKLKELDEYKKKIKERLYERFEVEIENSLNEVRNVVKDLQKDKNSQNAEKTRKDIQNISKKVRNKYGEMVTIQKKENELEVVAGEFYYLDRLRQVVEVLKAPDKDEKVFVQAGSLKLTVDLKDLSKVEGKEMKQKVKSLKATAPATKVTKGKSRVSESYRNSFNEIDLRGQYVQDALEVVENFVDESVLHNVTPIYIIHGIGSGALKQAIRDYLRSVHSVTYFRPGENHEGGDGVTVVYFKD